MKRLLARVTEDGYLLGTTDNFSRGWFEAFWSDHYEDEYNEDDQKTVEIEVPDEMVPALLEHGTSGQVYSDGYEAWNDVLEKGKVFDGKRTDDADSGDAGAVGAGASRG